MELRASELAMILDGIDVSKLKRVPRYEGASRINKRNPERKSRDVCNAALFLRLYVMWLPMTRCFPARRPRNAESAVAALIPDSSEKSNGRGAAATSRRSLRAESAFAIGAGALQEVVLRAAGGPAAIGASWRKRCWTSARSWTKRRSTRDDAAPASEAPGWSGGGWKAAQGRRRLANFENLPVTTQVYELSAENGPARAAERSGRRSARRRAGRSSTCPGTSSASSTCARSMPAGCAKLGDRAADSGGGAGGVADRARHWRGRGCWRTS